MESATLEYKATLRTHDSDGAVFKLLETGSLKTIAAFLNSRDGGTLLIGVRDDGAVHGLASDYASLRKPGKGDRDVFEQHLANIVSASMGVAAATNIGVQIHHVDGNDICRVHVRPSGFPVEAIVTVDKQGQHVKKTAFYVRVANGTRELSDLEKDKYLKSHWGN